MKKPALWLACSAALTTAYAADWVPIEFDGDGVAIYMDKTSIKANGSKRQGWSKIVRETPQIFEGKLWLYLVAMHEFDCSDRTQRMLSEIGYDTENRQVYHFGEQKEVTYIAPDTMGAARIDAVCKLKIRSK